MLAAWAHQDSDKFVEVVPGGFQPNRGKVQQLIPDGLSPEMPFREILLWCTLLGSAACTAWGRKTYSLVKPVLRTAHLGQIKDCRFAVGANIRNHCFSHRNILLLPFRLPRIKVSIRSVDGGALNPPNPGPVRFDPLPPFFYSSYLLFATPPSMGRGRAAAIPFSTAAEPALPDCYLAYCYYC